jgi:ParB family chromosome partitioning protein
VAEPVRKNTGLGKGLGALLSVVPREDGTQEQLKTLPVSSIVPNPRQPRKQFNEKALDALSGSIGERGVLQPVLVRSIGGGKWELIAGERRWRAAQTAGLTEIPAVIRNDDDAVALEVALIENMAREDLSPIEEAKACAALVDELGLTKESVGKRVGRSRAAVSNLIRLLDLPDEAIEMLEDGRLTEGHGRALLMAPRHDDRKRLAAEAFSRGWSVRTTEDRARDIADGKRDTVSLHPDHEAAITDLLEMLEAATSGDVKITAKGDGCRVTLGFESMLEAASFARQVKD